jgi:hypothetical protein
LNTKNGHVSLKNNSVQYTALIAPNKLLGILVLGVELVAFFKITNTPLEVDTPIGLRIVFGNTNDYEKQTWF